MHASQEQSDTQTDRRSAHPGSDDHPPVRRGKLNFLFPVSAVLSFLFIFTAMVVANPISHELDGPFVRAMKANGMWVMAIEVVAILATGLGAMWLESRTTPVSAERVVSDSHSESKAD